MTRRGNVSELSFLTNLALHPYTANNRPIIAFAMASKQERHPTGSRMFAAQRTRLSELAKRL